MVLKAEQARRFGAIRDRLHIHDVSRAEAEDQDTRARIQREGYRRDLQEVMDMPSGAGLRVLRDILDRGGLLGQPHNDNPSRAAYRAGQLEVARTLWLNMVSVDPPTAQLCLTVIAEDKTKETE